jgi:PAT family beta-lactamase induction signal transducer AmpG
MAYTVMACSMIVGLIAVAFTPKTADSLLSEPLIPLIENNNTSWNQTINNFFKQSLITPFKSFVERFGIQDALIILLLVSTYRISDIVMGVMANPFYVSMKFSKLEVASITKVYGVIMTLAGASVGGLLCIRWGVLRIMLLGAILSALTNCLFSGLATLINEDPDLKLKALTAVISADNFASGIAATAFIAYMSNLTSKGYSATQYALLSSLMVLFPKYIAGLSGGVVENIGYVHFFNGTALMGVPVIMLLLFIIYSHRKITIIN